MKQQILNRKFITALCLILFFIVLILMPWQLVPYNRNVRLLYSYTLEACWLIPSIYILLRLLYPLTMEKKPGIAFIFIIILAFFIIITIVPNPPAQSNYMNLYTHVKKSNETIRIIHNRFPLHNWNESMHIIEFPELGFRVERNFKQKDLNGSWYVHKDNPYCKSEGIFTFENGKVIHPN